MIAEEKQELARSNFAKVRAFLFLLSITSSTVTVGEYRMPRFESWPPLIKAIKRARDMTTLWLTRPKREPESRKSALRLLLLVVKRTTKFDRKRNSSSRRWRWRGTIDRLFAYCLFLAVFCAAFTFPSVAIALSLTDILSLHKKHRKHALLGF